MGTKTILKPYSIKTKNAGKHLNHYNTNQASKKGSAKMPVRKNAINETPAAENGIIRPCGKDDVF